MFLYLLADEIVAISSEALSRASTANEGQLSFEDISSVMEEMSITDILPFEGPDPKVAEFLRILEGLSMIVLVSRSCSKAALLNIQRSLLL